MNNVELYFIFACLLISVFLICDFLHRKKLYEAGSYYNITKTPFILIGRNIGSYGEYLIYETLKHLESERAKFLFNLYIPTYNGKTTEIDAVMISQCGIFFFESKNYSGWIFGNENQKMWTQSLCAKSGTQKEHFFNPIMQNQYHIDYLRKLIGKNVQTYSIIVFSDNCKLKNITRNTNSKAILTYRSKLYRTVNDICSESVDFLTLMEVNKIYDILYKYSQVDETVKSRHILNLKTVK